MEIADEFIEQIIWERCLPKESREDILEMNKIEDDEEFYEQLNVLTSFCYRNNPNHPRYDRNRNSFPRVPVTE